MEDRCLLSGDPFTVFPLGPGHYSMGITAGPDGNLWFTEDLTLVVGRITPTGKVTEFPSDSDGGGITTGPDGNIWYSRPETIARITPAGKITSFLLDSSGGANETSDITAGPDGSLWFLMFEGAENEIGRITTDGTVSLFPLPLTTSAYGLASGPDGNLWLTEGGKIGRFSPTGTLTEFAITPGVQNSYGNSPGSLLADSNCITAGPDGNLWFTQSWTSRIGRTTPAGVITEFTLPDNAVPTYITTGPDGNLWYTGVTSGVPGAAPSQGLIGRISPTGSVSQLIVTPNTFAPEGIVAGPDGNLWIADFENIVRLSPDAFGDGASAPLVVEQGTSLAASFSTLALSASPSTKVTIDWGDGQVSQGTLDAGQTTPAPSVPGVPVGGGQTSPHSLTALAANSYLQPGTYLAVVSFDQGNGTRATVERMIEVTSNPNANFVKQLYQDFLQRSFDPAGFAYWLNQMHQGMTRPQVVEGFQNSPEYLSDSVQALYHNLLGRPADPVGLTGSVAYLMGGGSLDQVRITLLASPEYFRQRGGGTNAGFLAALYENALHRQIDPSGAESWTRVLEGSGTTSSEAVRMLVAAMVSQSDEALTGQVQSFYQSFLHRRADTPGLAAFLAARKHGMSADQVVQMVAGSDEYFARVAT